MSTSLIHNPRLHICGKRMIPCVFGHPDDRTLRMAKLGRVKLMGCIIRESNPPAYWCPYCRSYVHD